MTCQFFIGRSSFPLPRVLSNQHYFWVSSRIFFDQYF